MNRLRLLITGAGLLLLAACSGPSDQSATAATVDTAGNGDSLPAPFATESSVNLSKVVGWPDSLSPKAPEGFSVTRFAGGLNSPRWIYIAPNGDILVAEARTTPHKGFGANMVEGSRNINKDGGANRILLFRDTDNDGVPDMTSNFMTGLNQPFGMLIIGSSFYVANTDGVWKYAYKEGDTRISGPGKKIVSLPAGGYNNHWTRNIITNQAQDKLYISVGSGSNVAEHGMENEVRRANILVTDLEGGQEQVYASGLRNPVGMDWAPGTQTLWTAVNERDELGDELVPDYLTSVKPDGFYGWPYAYWGQHPDPRMKGAHMELVRQSLVPDVNLGSHTASLGLAFSKGGSFPAPYASGAFIGQHGSWNRSQLSGYKVVYVPFKNGKPDGKPRDFLTGFIVKSGESEVHGRPVGIAFTKSGYMLVADDAANIIWCVKANTTR
ncbi:PQQ-dependent sugar dehydrogenase [Taibaiella koreensis]|uniref:PQQ-dependent sugar dehydrogenase n=1 Tax=Taibaiella koreensis TaxID=1268548 RepID=UPI000E59AA8F|nr:sorbosone dehydrogenase family protein [Taibaiella koreensis]